MSDKLSDLLLVAGNNEIFCIFFGAEYSVWIGYSCAFVAFYDV
jgi:hypothetical protein